MFPTDRIPRGGRVVREGGGCCPGARWFLELLREVAEGFATVRARLWFVDPCCLDLLLLKAAG